MLVWSCPLQAKETITQINDRLRRKKNAEKNVPLKMWKFLLSGRFIMFCWCQSVQELALRLRELGGEKKPRSFIPVCSVRRETLGVCVCSVKKVLFRMDDAKLWPLPLPHSDKMRERERLVQQLDYSSKSTGPFCFFLALGFRRVLPSDWTFGRRAIDIRIFATYINFGIGFPS